MADILKVTQFAGPGSRPELQSHMRRHRNTIPVYSEDCSLFESIL